MSLDNRAIRGQVYYTKISKIPKSALLISVVIFTFIYGIISHHVKNKWKSFLL